MAVQLVSDLVSDTMRAADPARRALALKRLQSTVASSPASGPVSIAKPAAAPAREVTDIRPAISIISRSSPAAARPAEAPQASADRTGLRITSAAIRTQKTAGPGEKFEAFFLQDLVKNLLPQEKSGLFGKGAAGSFWRSMLAQSVSTEMAGSGSFGIASLINKVVAELRPANSDAKEGAQANSRIPTHLVGRL